MPVPPLFRPAGGGLSPAATGSLLFCSGETEIDLTCFAKAAKASAALRISLIPLPLSSASGHANHEPFMPVPLLSASPVELPLADLPARFHPLDGAACILVDGGLPSSPDLSVLRFRVTRCGEGVVTVEAWAPWVRPADNEFPSSASFLTAAGARLLSERY